METNGTRSAHDRELRLFLPGALGMGKEGKPALTIGGKTEAGLRRSVALGVASQSNPCWRHPVCAAESFAPWSKAGTC
jgi:hypothetical protein